MILPGLLNVLPIHAIVDSGGQGSTLSGHVITAFSAFRSYFHFHREKHCAPNTKVESQFRRIERL